MHIFRQLAHQSWIQNCTRTMILRDALITNSSLESITVLGNATFESITGWRAFCSIFAHKMCTIKHLWIQETSIYNEGATILGDALPISQDNSITSVGWQGFSTCLRGRNSALEKLYIGMCRMDDEGSIQLWASWHWITTRIVFPTYFLEYFRSRPALTIHTLLTALFAKLHHSICHSRRTFADYWKWTETWTK